MVAVDSTVATPVLTRPLELGADIVMHAATKYLNGHSDLIAGALVTREESTTVAAHQVDARAARRRRRTLRGLAADARHAHAVSARARRVRERAGDRANISRSHPRVAEVLYPGLPRFPGHEVAARQMHGGFGGMMSVRGREAVDPARERPSRPRQT